MLNRVLGLTRRHAIALATVALATAFAQVATLMQVPLSSFSMDSPAYVVVAQQLSESLKYLVQPLRTPGYSLFMLAVFKLTGSPFSAPFTCYNDYHAGCDLLFRPVVIAQALVMTVTIFEIYVLGYWLTRKRWMAAVVAIVGGCNLYVFSWERFIDSETLSMWAIVTVMLIFYRYMRRPSVGKALLLAAMLIVAVMIRPFNELVPAMLIVLVLARAAWTRSLRAYWKSAVLVPLVVYAALAGYSQINGRVNGVYDISFVTNINLFGKVLEYRMQGEHAPARYASIQQVSDVYVAHFGITPFGVFSQFGSTPQQATGMPGGHYAPYGAFARYIILHHPWQYAVRSVPDIYRAWMITDYMLYPDYGHGRTYAQPPGGVPWMQAGISAYDTRNGMIPLYTNPVWTNIWLILSTLEELSFGLLPFVIGGALIWLWVDRENIDAFNVLSLAALVTLTILITALASYDQYARLRFPAEWAMFTINAVAVLRLFDACVSARRRVSTPALATTPSAAPMGGASQMAVVAPLAPTLIRTNGRDEESPVNYHARVPGGSRPASDQTPRNVVIMGAGPAGLTAAYELTRYQIPTLVFERDPQFVGGISRTEQRNGYRFDIGGHRFFSKSQEIEDFWTEVGSDLLLTRGRLSRIYYRGKYFDYPLKAGNALLNMGPFETVRCVSSYVWAKLRPVRNPRSLEDWVRNQFGYRLFSIFFKTYTEKVWGISTSELSADWAAQRIKGLDLSQAIRNALPGHKRQPSGDRGAIVKTLIDEFRYPRLGPGQLWERVRDRLRAAGQHVVLGQQVVAIHHSGGRVTQVVVRDVRSGEERAVTATDYISTLPMRELVQRCVPALPEHVQRAAVSLKYRDFLTVAVVIDRPDLFPDNWIYIHDPSVQVGRMQNFKNWSPEMVPDQSKTCLGLEYFCFEGDGVWESADDDLVELARRELVQLGMCGPEEVLWGAVVRQPKAYPVYDDVYKTHLAVIRAYLHDHLANLSLVGRNGMHHYNNQDHSMMTALLVARNIATGSSFDPWKVNTDAEYHEEAKVDDEDRSGKLRPTRVVAPATVDVKG